MFRILIFCVISILYLNPQDVTAVEANVKTMQKLYNQMFKYGPTKFKPFKKMPDMSKISKLCARKEFFYTMNKKHMAAVQKVKNIFSVMKSPVDTFKMMMALRDHPEMNPKVWNYAIESYLYNHPEMQLIHKRKPWESTPDNFINGDYLRLVKGKHVGLGISARATSPGQCVILDERFGADNGIENLLWYWREDIMLNAHHWYWHLVYVIYPPVKLDRAGELFYFFHEGVMARYNTERIANGLERVRPFNLFVGAIIEEGYNAHMRDDNSGYNWTDRKNYTSFSDTDRPSGNHRVDNVSVSVRSMVTARDRIIQAIDQEAVVATNGTRIPLTPYRGIDILADIVVAINASVNPNFYGINRDGIHNNGHDVFGEASDPKFAKKLPPGVMDDFGTSMRDVIFYPWHEFIREFFDRHKRRLRPYTPLGGDFPLHWAGVYLNRVQVFGKTDNGATVYDQMETFWTTRNIPLTHGLDFFRNKSTIQICVKHLDHREYTYKIEIERDASLVTTTKATVRIFLAPRYREDGYRMSLLEQRRFFFALDTFTTTLKPGLNTILRESTASTLTLPWQDTYNQLQMSNNEVTPNCGCGWPHHLLLPKGSRSGTDYDLVVMVTNGDTDAVVQTQPPNAGNCKSAYLYCGLVNQKYPDARPMGYPFDRLPYNWSPFDPPDYIPTLENFMRGITNMRGIQVRIFHRG